MPFPTINDQLTNNDGQLTSSITAISWYWHLGWNHDQASNRAVTIQAVTSHVLGLPDDIVAMGLPSITKKRCQLLLKPKLI